MFDLLFLLALIIPIIASINVHSTTKKFKKIRSVTGKTGFEVARQMLDANGLSDLYIVETPGELTDCYDSKRKTVKLSTDVFHGTSITALAVAAHECGHAIQDKEGYFWMQFRSMIFPVVSFGTSIAYYVLIAGILFEAFYLIEIAILLVGLGLLFQVVTLPVEFDASKRAKAWLYDSGLVSNEERSDVAKVLTSAALTYVAGVISSALDLIRLIGIFNRRD